MLERCVGGGWTGVGRYGACLCDACVCGWAWRACVRGELCGVCVGVCGVGEVWAYQVSVCV